MSNQKLLIFICSRTKEINERRLSHRIARYLEGKGIGDIGKVQTLGEQLSLAPGQRRKMIFLNDCNANCVKVLTTGFLPDEFIYVDVSKKKNSVDFDPEIFFKETITSLLRNISYEPIVRT